MSAFWKNKSESRGNMASGKLGKAYYHVRDDDRDKDKRADFPLGLLVLKDTEQRSFLNLFSQRVEELRF